MTKQSIWITIDAKDKASKEIKKINGLFSDLHKKMIAIAGPAAIGAVGAASIKMSAEFSKSMSNVSTLVDTGTEDMEKMKKEVIDISKKTPVALADLSSALYDVRSAGIDAAGAMDVLENSARLAVAGLGTTKEATDVLTSAINAFGLDAKKSDKWADVFFKSVKAGKTTVAELAHGFGQIAPLASKLGVEFEELMATTAAMTTSGMKASIAYSQQRAMLSNLLKPTKEMAELMKKTNITNIEAEIRNKGLRNTIIKLTDAAEGNSEMMAKAFGSVEGLNAVLMLLGETGKNATAIMDDMKNGSDALTEAFKKQNKEASAQYQLLKNQLNAELINLGNIIIPILLENIPKVIRFFKDLKTVLKVVSEKVNKLNDDLKLISDTIKDKFEELRTDTDILKEAFVGMVNDIKTKISDGFESIKTTISEKMSEFSGIVEEKINKANKFLENFGNIEWGNVFKKIFEKLIEFELEMVMYLNETWGSWGKAIKKGIEDGVIELSDGLTKMGENISRWFTDIATKIIEGLNNWTKGFSEWTTGMILKMSSWLDNMKQSVINWFSNLFKEAETVEAIETAQKDMVDNMVQSLDQNKLSLIGKWSLIIIGVILALPPLLALSILTFVTECVLKMIQAFKDKFPEIKKILVEGFMDAFKAVESIVIEKVNWIAEQVRNIISQIKSIPSSIGAGISRATSYVTDRTGRRIHNDFISRPGMPPVPFSPQDTIIGVKNPAALGAGGITVNINGGTYLSEEAALDIGDSIIERLKNNFRI